MVVTIANIISVNEQYLRPTVNNFVIFANSKC